MIRIARFTLQQVRIPLKRRIQHASHTRDSTDNLVASCTLSDGTTGWGEGLPRPYVTGETVEDAWELWRNWRPERWAAPFDTLSDLLTLAEALVPPPAPTQRDGFGNSLRCALELALLDAGCRALGCSVSSAIAAFSPSASILVPRSSAQYSAALTSSSPRKLALRSWLFRLAGFRQCKVKVGVHGRDDVALMQLVRRHFGRRVELRLDANEAWSLDTATRQLGALERFHIAAIEQPLPQSEWDGLAELRRRTPIPVMLDESLCTLADAERAISHSVCDSFNLRLSKCGGLLPVLKLAARAREAGLRCQLGCQVGETGILSAAGRHVACQLSGLTAVEGSFDRFLVSERLTREDLTFGWAGRAPALTGPGLGVTMDTAALNHITTRHDQRNC